MVCYIIIPLPHLITPEVIHPIPLCPPLRPYSIMPLLLRPYSITPFFYAPTPIIPLLLRPPLHYTFSFYSHYTITTQISLLKYCSIYISYLDFVPSNGGGRGSRLSDFGLTSSRLTNSCLPTKINQGSNDRKKTSRPEIIFPVSSFES